MKVFFLDTNIFLQCKDVDKLRWNEVAGNEDEILLLIPTPVEKEINNLKQDGNRRRSKRARIANSMMRDILKANDAKLILKKSKPFVEISFVPTDILKIAPPHIDTSTSDDRIVAEAVSYTNLHPTSNVFILTNDTLLMRTAQRNKLQYVEIPSDWFLDPEPDPKEKIIKGLEDQLKQLQKTLPLIDVTISDINGAILKQSVTIVVRNFRELDGYEIEELIMAARNERTFLSKSEIEKNAELAYQLAPSLMGFNKYYEPPSDADIQNYFEECEKWAGELEAFVKELPGRISSISRNFRMVVSIRNSGSVPAENVVVEFKLPNGLLLRPPSDSFDFDIASLVPKCPQPPEGQWISRPDPVAHSPYFSKLEPTFPRFEPLQNATSVVPLVVPVIPHRRDRHCFYPKQSKPSDFSHLWKFECEEFRHQVDPEQFEVIINVPDAFSKINSVFEYRITAKNLPNPHKNCLRLTIEFLKGDTLAEVRKFLGLC